MKFKVLFILNDAKKCRVLSGYRPTWIGDNKPEHSSGMVYWSGGDAVSPGEAQEAVLWPLAPQLWEDIRINDTLKCMEGSREVGEAIVLEIIPDVPVV